jgi:hypothetical protein
MEVLVKQDTYQKKEKRDIFSVINQEKIGEIQQVQERSQDIFYGENLHLELPCQIIKEDLSYKKNNYFFFLGYIKVRKMSQFLTREQEDMMCKYSSYIVCAAAVIVGLKAFDKDIIGDMLVKGKQAEKLTQEEKMAYGLLFAAGVACVWCHYNKRY